MIHGNVIKSKGRTNRNCWIGHFHDRITTQVAQRISLLVKMPIEHAEKYQIIHYGVGEKYEYHHDGFPMDQTIKSKTFTKMGGQRMVTALVYLNDVEEGGETGFKKLNIEVKAKKGRIVVFENCKKDTNIIHPDSLHSGRPVIKGEKYAFNLWFRQIPINQIFDRKKKYEEYKIKKIPIIKFRPPRKISRNKSNNLNIINNNKIKTGIISTIGKPFFFDSWLNYHLNKIKIDKIIILFDEENFPEMKSYFNNILKIYGEKIILEKSVSNNHLITKQKGNFIKGLEIAKKNNIDFIFHIDDDELIYIQNDSMDNILKKYENINSPLHFDNFEIYRTYDKTDDYNFFKFEKLAKMRNNGIFNSYFNGKAGGFIKDNLIWNGPHFIKCKNKGSKDITEIKILHYSNLLFSQWKNKYNIIDPKNKLNFKFHNKSLELLTKYKNNLINELELQKEFIKLSDHYSNVENLINQKVFKINLKNEDFEL